MAPILRHTREEESRRSFDRPPRADHELALFGTTGYRQDREGLGIYDAGGGTGYIVSADQLPGESVFHVYRREGEPGRPHDHSATLLSFTGGADGTDCLDVTSATLGPEFPGGLVVAMNAASRNFLLFRWYDIASAATPPLKLRDEDEAPGSAASPPGVSRRGLARRPGAAGRMP